MPSSLPEFDRPPLEEVAISVLFKPLAGLHAAHHGRFWDTIRDRYPTTETHPPVLAQEELLEPKANVEELKLIPAVPRSWFLDESKNHLIQLQRNLFIRNWRRLSGEEEYPRFGTLIQEYRREYHNFASFVKSERLGDINVKQCELTYINHLERGPGSGDFENLAAVFSALRPREPDSFPPPPEMFSWEAKYKIPDGRGRLNIDVNPVFRGRDLKIVLQFQLVARGAPASTSDDDVFAWFDLGHEWIVRAFHGLTTEKMHKLWGERV